MTTTIDTIAWIRIEGGKILSTRSRGKDVYYITIIPATARHLGTFQAQAHGHTDGVIVRLTCYTADYRGTPEPGSEIDELRWLTYADRGRVAPVDQIVFEHLHHAGRLT